MRIRKRKPSIEELIREADRENLKRLSSLEGNKSCSGMGCSKTTGMPCSYVDRRGRHCGTAWCPTHRSVYELKVFCPLHASTMQGIKSEFAESVHPDVENRIPAMVGWVARTAEDDLIATMQKMASERGEILVSDPVQLLFRTVDRIKTWERSWKSCSAGGPGCRVSIGIEEKTPDEIIVRVNGYVVSRMETPWRELETANTKPVEAHIFRKIVMPVSFALDQWQQGVDIEAERAFVPSSASAALDYIGEMIFEEEGIDMGDLLTELTAEAAASEEVETAGAPSRPEAVSESPVDETDDADIEVTAHPVFESLLEQRVPAGAGAGRARRPRAKVKSTRRIITRPPRRR